MKKILSSKFIVTQKYSARKGLSDNICIKQKTGLKKGYVAEKYFGKKRNWVPRCVGWGRVGA